ncbi:sugar-binding transcriptional regulator [Hoyosella subflava]|uniref:Transcriptional regulator n=1 Tax=Hoyosella subflava (strain DSM 45089 / JCM 17490 / NBRC 109087 / DQS3-9A1) TaxID=443218 RepID=F6EQJ5_HOYSD|nr:sugar-binding domain-containing protein [Hoyosella subflava]AEF41872.1 Transcriptional regulator [Hoyosella subflava DQS3-9A1]
MASGMGPDELVRLAHIARQHFVAGKTRIEIAEELGLSRFKVGRLLDDAINSGIIRFEIAVPGPIDDERSSALQRQYALKRAVVVRTPTELPDAVQEQLGRVGADLLREIAGPDDILGLTAGRTLNQLGQALSSFAIGEVVQLAGVAGPVHATGVEVIRRVSSVAHGRAWTLYAPLIASDIAAAEAIRRQHDVAQTLRQFDRVTVALVAIGSWDPPDSQFYDNLGITLARRNALEDKGVVADIGAILIDGQGRVVDDVQQQCISIDAAGLRRIPEVVGIAGGGRKTGAVRAALASGLIDSLVTDSALAARLLEE